MTKIPLFSLPSASASFFLRSKSVPQLRLFSALAMASSNSGITSTDFPIPLTPPHPPHSREVELRRAMSASARSGAPFDLSVVFEDEWIAVVNKPSGVYCDSILSSLSSSIAAGSSTSSCNVHLANRLDRDTSGLMVVTKHNKAAARLVKSFTDHTVSKTYLALSLGPAPDWCQAHITSGHGRSKHGAWRVYSVDDVDRTLPGGSHVKHMETAFEVLSINRLAKFHEPRNFLDTGIDSEVKSIDVRDKVSHGENKSTRADEVLMRAYPKSGRTHQIRLHCQYLGLPIRGDVKYGGVCEWNGVEYDFHALHAETLSFVHPITDVQLNLKAPLPSWVKEMAPTI
ncbi:Ribosomal large subunit pseudouridine synthase C [Rhynchospora pubera]|uniref:Ribosomal large subunit pseudouridine synthase C n=1 Tax=Rhynchospora pubera TaxID=906938 RepID=A0AAV8CA69_9POAL|nr:Ribosomal large subunit pseudouridine synthase C [Rhynchospora pubera]